MLFYVRYSLSIGSHILEPHDRTPAYPVVEAEELVDVH